MFFNPKVIIQELTSRVPTCPPPTEVIVNLGEYSSYDALPTDRSATAPDDGTAAIVTETHAAGIYVYVASIDGYLFDRWLPSDVVARGVSYAKDASTNPCRMSAGVGGDVAFDISNARGWTTTGVGATSSITNDGGDLRFTCSADTPNQIYNTFVPIIPGATDLFCVIEFYALSANVAGTHRNFGASFQVLDGIQEMNYTQTNLALNNGSFYNTDKASPVDIGDGNFDLNPYEAVFLELPWQPSADSDYLLRAWPANSGNGNNGSSAGCSWPECGSSATTEIRVQCDSPDGIEATFNVREFHVLQLGTSSASGLIVGGTPGPDPTIIIDNTEVIVEVPIGSFIDVLTYDSILGDYPTGLHNERFNVTADPDSMLNGCYRRLVTVGGINTRDVPDGGGLAEGLIVPEQYGARITGYELGTSSLPMQYEQVGTPAGALGTTLGCWTIPEATTETSEGLVTTNTAPGKLAPMDITTDWTPSGDRYFLLLEAEATGPGGNWDVFMRYTYYKTAVPYEPRVSISSDGDPTKYRWAPADDSGPEHSIATATITALSRIFFNFTGTQWSPNGEFYPLGGGGGTRATSGSYIEYTTVVGDDLFGFRIEGLSTLKIRRFHLFTLQDGSALGKS